MTEKQTRAFAEFHRTLKRIPEEVFDPTRPLDNDPHPTEPANDDEQHGINVGKLWYFIWELSAPGTPLHEAFLRDGPAQFTDAQLEAATGITRTPVRAAIAQLDRGSLGPIRRPRNSSVLVQPPTPQEMWQFGHIRILFETEAALYLHQRQKLVDNELQHDEHFQSYLHPHMFPTLSALEQLIETLKSSVSDHTTMDREGRIAFEDLFHAKTAFHERICQLAGMTEHAKIVRMLRYKKRMWHSYRPVTLKALGTDHAQHLEIYDAIRAQHEGESSEQRVREAVRNNIIKPIDAYLACPYPCLVEV